MMQRLLTGLYFLLSAVTVQAGESYIVMLRDGAQPTAAMRSYVRPVVAASGKQVDAVQRAALAPLQRFAIVEVPDTISMSLDDVASMPWVEAAYPNRKIPLHCLEPEPVPNPTDSVPRPYGLSIIGASKAWTMATGDGVVVGIIDTGIEWWHPSLAAQLWVNPAEDANGNGTFEFWDASTEDDGVFGDLDGIDNDGNGYIDDVIGYDFEDKTFRNVDDDSLRDERVDDRQGHGTSVAGVVAAIDTNGNVPVGLAYDARLMTLRAFDVTGNAEEDDIAAALLYAAMNGAHVVNMSFGDGVDSPLLRAAVKAAADMGCILVASAGNTGTTSRQYPASYDDVIAVAATNERDVRAPFSSTGSTVRIAAPGQSIVTTAIGRGYRTVSGTSFAAPYVAAAAALLKERHPSWTAREILSTLRETSVDLGESGWDPLHGDGRLQADAALRAAGAATIGITRPGNEQEIDLRKTDTLRVIGSAVSTVFAGYEVRLGRGVEPSTWDVIATSQQQRLDTTLAVIAADQLAPGPYVIALRVITRSGRALEDRKRITVVDTSLTFVSTDVVRAWNGNRRALVLTAKTSRPSLLKVHVIKGTDTVRTVVDQMRRTRTHSLTLDDLPTRTALLLRLEAIGDAGDTARTSVPATLVDEVAPASTYQILFTSTRFTGYVLNDVRDVYGDGSRTILVTDLSDGAFGSLEAYNAPAIPADTFNPGWKRLGHRTTTTWIPRGVGDANGDGIVDILCHVVGRTALFQAATRGGSPFERTIFVDTLSGNLQAAAMADITGDGREELLCITDSGLVALSFNGTQFVQIGHVPNTTPPAPGNADNRYDEITAAAGDFDGDGRVEVAFADTDGDLVIGEWTGTGMRVEATFEHDGQGGSGYVMAHDVDNDGRKEVFLGVPDSVTANAENEYGRQLWTYRMFRGLGNDDIRLAWVEHYAGLRYGMGYRNGLDGGQLDGSGGSEIALCMYPNMYVYTWDSTKQTLRPIWYAGDAASPRMIFGDHDGNGTPDLLYGQTTFQRGRIENGIMTRMAVVQADVFARTDQPRVRIVGRTNAEVTWRPVPRAVSYTATLATFDTVTSLQTFEGVAGTSIQFDTLRPGVRYRFYVTPVIPGDTMTFRSQVFFTMPVVSKPVSIDPDTITRDQLRRGASFRVVYNATVVPDEAERSLIEMEVVREVSEENVRPTLVQVLGQSSVNVVFPPLDAEGVEFLSVGLPEVPLRVDSATPQWVFPITIIDEAVPEMYLRNIVVESPERIKLTYSEPIDPVTAADLANYSLSPFGTIRTVAAAGADNVQITFDGNRTIGARGITYYITVRDVKAASGREITKGAGNTLGFAFTAEDLADVYVYPHPVRLATDETVTFANLPASASVEILDQRFSVVRMLRETDANGGVAWDLRTDADQQVPPGIYFYRVQGQGDDVLGKLVINR